MTTPNVEASVSALHAATAGTTDTRSAVLALLYAVRGLDWSLGYEMDEDGAAMVFACVDTAAAALVRAGGALDLGMMEGTA